MSVSFYLKRSSTASKRPLASGVALGELALNYDSATGGLYYKDSADNVVKVGPAQVSNSAPNSSPAGSSGNSVGEFWYDTMTSALKVWNGSAWVATNTNGAYVDKSVFTAKGDLLVGTAPNTSVALAVGVDGYVLVADSTEATGLKWVAPAAGGVTSITAGTGLTGGTITTTGTIALDTSGVTANSYTFANVTVDTYGRVTAASDGGDATIGAKGIVQVGTNIDVTSGTISVADGSSAAKGVLQVGTNLDVAAGVVSVADASTSIKGVVQLNDTTTSTSTSLALTAAQGKSLQDQIDALAVTSNIILGGTFDANTGEVDSVTAAGTTAGLVVGSALPAAAPANDQIFVIVDVQGSTGPSGAPPYHIGDWFLSDGSAWQFLNVGFQPGQATTVSQGVVQLATDAEVQAGTDASNAVVSSSLQSKLSDSVSTTSSTTIASSTAVKSAYDLANGKVTGVTGTAPVTVDNTDPKNPIVGVNTGTTSATGVLQLTDSTSSTSATTAATPNAVKTTYDLANAALPKSTFTALGDLVVGTGSSTYTALTVGSNGEVLSANSACASGLAWVAGGGGGSPATPTVAGIVLGCTTLTNSALGCNSLVATTTGTNNTTAGAGALCSNIAGNNNTAVGFLALSSTTANQNTAVGSCALRLATTSCNSTAVGFCALSSVVAGSNNTAMGACTLRLNTGNSNTAFGTNGLTANTTGGGNTTVGSVALCSNATGACNTAVGNLALGANVGGCFNTATGFCALRCNTGGGNTAVGCGALALNVSGNDNVAIGCSALSNVTTGAGNVGIGTNVAVVDPTGNFQLAIGFGASQNWLTGTSNRAIKPGAGIIDCAGSCGANGAVLMSNGANAVCWGTYPFATIAEMGGVVTTATASAAATTITVASGSGISDGDTVSAPGITPGTTVVSGGGTTSIVLSEPVGGPLSTSPVTFYTNTKIVSPGDTASGLARAWVNFNTGVLGTWPAGAATFTRVAGQTTATIITTNDHGMFAGGWVWSPMTGVASSAQLYQVVAVPNSKTFTITSTNNTLQNALPVTFTVLSIKNSYNIHSVVPITGAINGNSWLVNFKTRMPDADYAVVGSQAGGNWGIGVSSTTYAPSTAGFQILGGGTPPAGYSSIVVFR